MYSSLCLEVKVKASKKKNLPLNEFNVKRTCVGFARLVGNYVSFLLFFLVYLYFEMNN